MAIPSPASAPRTADNDTVLSAARAEVGRLRGVAADAEAVTAATRRQEDDLIARLRDAGYSRAEIASAVGCSPAGAD